MMRTIAHGLNAKLELAKGDPGQIVRPELPRLRTKNTKLNAECPRLCIARDGDQQRVQQIAVNVVALRSG